ncbi:HIT family hydrolase [Candidatus Saccharibacteria bacterium RIFCSPHIGHO2_12_FULL_41_12]|nr:MAG: HIT family hydrolase [Candidatus Saccharibacteria bacterium RIFCSPHIGHO2_12_FULL_41_12]
MQDSIFTKIINGEIPAHKIYEDDKTMAFLDIHPSVTGHTLVIPKKQVDHLWDLQDEDYQAVMATAKLVANRLRKVLLTQRVGVKVVGEDVPHVHIHLIPFNTTREFHAKQDLGAEPDHEALAILAQKLAF